MTTTTEQKIKKLAEKIKGTKAENGYGYITIQHNREAANILNKGYSWTNCNSLRENYRCRISYIENGEYHTTGIIRHSAANYFIELKFSKKSELRKKLEKKGYNITDILQNLSTNGYTGVYICSQVSRGNNPRPDKVENMIIAALRHADTSYDLIDKKGLSDYEVRELRRHANQIATA